MKSSKMSRRDFLKGTAAGAVSMAAMGLLGGCTSDAGTAGTEGSVETAADTGLGGVEGSVAAEVSDAPAAKTWRDAPDPIDDSQIKEEFRADVIVIGAGQSGTAAARAVAEAGKSVICLEAQSEDIYTTFGNDIGHINSEYLASQGVPKVDEIEFFNNWMLNTGNRANPELIMKFTKNCGKAFDWWIEPLSEAQIASMNVDFWPETGSTLHVMNTGLKYWIGTPQLYGQVDGVDFRMTDAYRIFHSYINSFDHAEVRYGMEAQQLVMDGADVKGVIAKDEDGNYVKFYAEKAVILAAGDFSSNAEMCADLLTAQAESLEEGEEIMGIGRNGRGIQMGYWAGGRLEPAPLPVLGDCDTAVPNRFAALWLDSEGKRYCNECFGDYVMTGYANVRRKHGVRYVVYDSSIMEAVKFNVPGHAAFDPTEPDGCNAMQEELEAAYAAGAEGVNGLYAADDLETLADYMGLEGEVRENFLVSIARYNENCEAQRDEDFGKDPRLLFPVAQAPFYGKVSSTGRLGFMLATNGGLITDGNQQVLNQSRDRINGLYATGNCCGLRFGPAYFTPIAGVSIGIAITMGKLLGEYVSTL